MGVRQNLAESQGDAVLAARNQARAALEEAELLQQAVPSTAPVPPAIVHLAAGEKAPPSAELPSVELLQRLVTEERARQQALEQAVAGMLVAHDDTKYYKQMIRDENTRLERELQQLLAGMAEEPAEAAAPQPAAPPPAGAARRNRNRKPRRKQPKTAPLV